MSAPTEDFTAWAFLEAVPSPEEPPAITAARRALAQAETALAEASTAFQEAQRAYHAALDVRGRALNAAIRAFQDTHPPWSTP